MNLALVWARTSLLLNMLYRNSSEPCNEAGNLIGHEEKFKTRQISGQRMILLQLGNFLWYNCMPVATGLQGALTLERKVAHGNEDPQDKWKV